MVLIHGTYIICTSSFCNTFRKQNYDLTMGKPKSKSNVTYYILCMLMGVYLWLWTRLSSSPHPASLVIESLRHPVISDMISISKTLPYVVPLSQRGSTLIVAFCNFHFRSVGVMWYKRMNNLGYDNHLLVATDQAMVDFLAAFPPPEEMRYHVWIHEPMPKEVLSRPKVIQEHAHLQLLMAVRWKYLLQQLEQKGMHVVLTDVDNIFTRYIDVDQEFTHKDTDVDVWHAYATKFPRKAFSQQGFCVCSGMSWWRASPGGIQFARLMRNTCGDMCDDQRELNNLLSTSPLLNMTWHWTEEAKQSRIANLTTNDPRFLGLPTVGISGRSYITGHQARIWDRDFAFRGPLFPHVCPANNWVSMPILEAKSRQSAWRTKIESFQAWDKHCEKQKQERWKQRWDDHERGM